MFLINPRSIILVHQSYTSNNVHSIVILCPLSNTDASRFVASSRLNGVNTWFLCIRITCQHVSKTMWRIYLSSSILALTLAMSAPLIWNANWPAFTKLNVGWKGSSQTPPLISVPHVKQSSAYLVCQFPHHDTCHSLGQYFDMYDCCSQAF